nr:unnamed protein product [Callosobruchus analis]
MCIYQYYTATQGNRRWWVRPMFQERTQKGAFTNLFNHMKTQDHEMFFKYTTMLPKQFDQLLDLLKPKLLNCSRREYLSPELRLAMTLKYLAHGGSFQSLSWEFRVGHSTVSKVIFETCTWKNVAQRFSDRWNFPHTIGAIDGKHVHIQCPINSGSEYYNYKGHFSIILLACCDADYKFTWVDIGAYGSEHDASVFRRSQMGIMLEAGTVALPQSTTLPGSNIEMPYFFVGDEAFPLKPYIMRPYPGRNLDLQKSVFNYSNSESNNMLTQLPSNSVCNNIYSPFISRDAEREGEDVTDGDWRIITRNDTNLTPVGRLGSNIVPNVVIELRNKLADYLMDLGSVSWQLNIEGYK